MFKYLLVLILCCTTAFSQNPCEFLRGDANGDGLINLSDVVAISTGGLSNEDAADVDDNASVNGLDALHLIAFLFDGGPPPALPYPAYGLDCTQDNLQLGCSVPNDKGPQYSVSGGVQLVNTTGWFIQTFPSTSSFIGVNADSCAGLNASTKIQNAWGNFSDSTGFSKNRLTYGVQEIELEVKVYFHAIPGFACRPYGCPPGSNTISLDLSNAFIELTHTIGSAVLNISGDWSETDLSLTYSRDANCNFQGLEQWTFIETFTSDNLTNQLAAAVGSSGETLGAVSTIRLKNARVRFQHGGTDITTQEEFALWINWKLNYEWCDVE